MGEALSARLDVENLKPTLKGEILSISYLPLAGLFLFGHTKVLAGSSVPMLEILVSSFLHRILRLGFVSNQVQ